MHPTRTLKTTLSMLAAVALLAAVGTSHAAVLYLNTFDDTGNVNLGGDTTDAPAFYNWVVPGTDGSSPSGAEGVDEQAFDSGDTVLSGDPSGDHGHFFVSSGNNLRFRNSPTTTVSNFYGDVVDEINELGAGDYTLTYQFDYAGEETTSKRSWKWNFFLFGDSNTAGGRWTNSGGLTTTTIDEWRHFSQTFEFTLVADPADAAPNSGVFTAGDFRGFAGGFELDNRAGDTDAEFRVDNVEITSQTIPEPATLALLGVGLAAVSRRRRAVR
jgi:hypothetical protein